MDNPKNYYVLLGVLPTAEPIVIRAAYRALAMKYHPDKWTGDKATAERRMREINQAYEILSDEQSRARYDSIRQNVDTDATNDAFRGAEKERRPDWWCRPGARKA
jgi:curved DNA-binding protein CbpA